MGLCPVGTRRRPAASQCAAFAYRLPHATAAEAVDSNSVAITKASREGLPSHTD
jgi:hypothetical protein